MVRGDTGPIFNGDDHASDIECAGGRVSVRTRQKPFGSGPNEDAAAVIDVGDNAVVLAVADGVGGAPAGRAASSTTLSVLSQSLSGDLDRSNLRSAILDGVERANLALLEKGGGTATTLAIAEIAGTTLRGYHIGDSELIVVGQRGRIKLRVIPHSPTGFAVEAGLLSEDEAVQHDQRHIISNVVGDVGMRVDIAAPVEIAPRDTVLMATDGVLDNLYIDEIVELVRVGPISSAADELMAAARARMFLGEGVEPSKPDDATIVLYRRSS